MAILEIPLDSDEPSISFRTVLDDNEYFFKIDWQECSERWIMHIFDINEVPLLTGLVLHINLELLNRFEIPGLPPGRIILFDNSGQGKECGRNDLGDRCKLLYYSESEITED